MDPEKKFLIRPSQSTPSAGVCPAPRADVRPRGMSRGQFQSVSPVLAYLTIIGPLVLNAARERAGSGRAEWPMFAHVSHADLTRHMHLVARRMLKKD